MFFAQLCRIAVQLNRTLRKDQPAHFEKLAEDESLAIQTPQQKLITPAVLSLLRSEGIYGFDTDACDHQAGSVLLQLQPRGQVKLVQNSLKSLKEGECGYNAVNIE